MSSSQQTQSQNTNSTRNRFHASQFSDQSRQNYAQYEREFQNIERMVSGNIQDEYIRTRVLDRLEEASLWIMRGISDTSTGSTGAARHS